MAGWLANTEIVWLKSIFIRKFINIYRVNMEEAEYSDPAHFASFNDFFCRSLKSGARPVAAAENSIVSPADGVFSQLGTITSGRMLQAKGRDFSVIELLGGSERSCSLYEHGQYATIYLSPKDYHRLHMPIDGKLLSMTYIPGDLFSVNPTTADRVPQLFARNERVVCLFETSMGPVSLVLVGAMIVASIETTWAGLVAPAGKKVVKTNYETASIHFKKGQEFARFKLGSTIIMLFPSSALRWSENAKIEKDICMGEIIAQIE